MQQQHPLLAAGLLYTRTAANLSLPVPAAPWVFASVPTALLGQTQSAHRPISLQNKFPIRFVEPTNPPTLY